MEIKLEEKKKEISKALESEFGEQKVMCEDYLNLEGLPEGLEFSVITHIKKDLFKKMSLIYGLETLLKRKPLDIVEQFKSVISERREVMSKCKHCKKEVGCWAVVEDLKGKEIKACPWCEGSQTLKYLDYLNSLTQVDKILMYLGLKKLRNFESFWLLNPIRVTREAVIILTKRLKD